MREEVLEKARMARFPLKPSRLKCIFACATEMDIREYVDTQMARHPGRVREPIYEVETTQSDPLTHRGDWNVAEMVLQAGRVAEIAADRYWQGVEGIDQPTGLSTYMEVITTSPLAVLRRLD
ncbi:DUF2441 domain-containing protein [Methylobacterium currus]|nr:DUF2441 domain-containing protein [Methylobacterium currus]